MAILPLSKDYTDYDFDAVRARLHNLIGSAFPTWKDQDTANFGNVLVEAFAFVGDVLGFYQDNQGREAFLPTATQRASILKLCKLIGYRPRGNTASTVDLELTLAAPAQARVVVPARTRVRTEAIVEPLIFETLVEVVFEVGEVGPKLVAAENAELREELFTARGLPNFEARMSGAPFLDGSLQVESSAGSFTVVDSFLSSAGVDRHCTVVVDEAQRATVRFGNGINGAVPTGTVTVRYRVGGGSRGRAEEGKVRRVERLFSDDNGNPVSLQVTNPEPSSAAEDRQTIEQIRQQAPETLRTQERSVAKEDYEINARSVPGVARALLLTAAQQAGIEENTGLLLIVPTGGGNPTQVVHDAVLEMVTVTKPKPTGFVVLVQAPSYRVVDVEATVYLRGDVNRATVRAAIQVQLEQAFRIELDDGTPNPTVDFGFNLRDSEGGAGRLAWSDLFNLVRDVPGVKRVPSGAGGLLLNGSGEDVELASVDFPSLGTVVVYDGATGTPIPLDNLAYTAARRALE